MSGTGGGGHMTALRKLALIFLSLFLAEGDKGAKRIAPR